MLQVTWGFSTNQSPLFLSAVIRYTNQNFYITPASDCSKKCLKKLTRPFQDEQVAVVASGIFALDTDGCRGRCGVGVVVVVRDPNFLKVVVHRAQKVKDGAVDGQIFLGARHRDVQQILLVLGRGLEAGR